MERKELTIIIGLAVFLVSLVGCAEFMTGSPRVTGSTPQTFSQVQAELISMSHLFLKSRFLSIVKGGK